MELPDSLIELARQPSAEVVWKLRGDLLARGLEPDGKACELLAELHRFLDRISTGAASRDHSERASKMEVASLSGVVTSDLTEASDPGEWARRMLAGIFTEGLAVLATRQHVKAWRGELASVYRETAWYLYGELWRWASRRKPDLDPEQRRILLEALMAPILGNRADDQQRTTLLCSLFILLLVDAIANRTSASRDSGAD